jgi:hypothetical protein
MMTMKKKLSMAAAAVLFGVCAIPMVASAHRWSPGLTFYAATPSCWSQSNGSMTNTCSTSQNIYLPATMDHYDVTSDGGVAVSTASGTQITCYGFGEYETGGTTTSVHASSPGPGYSYISLPGQYSPWAMLYRCTVPTGGTILSFDYDQ